MLLRYTNDMFVCQEIATRACQDSAHAVGWAVFCGAHGTGCARSNAPLAQLQGLRQPAFPGPEAALVVTKAV